MKMKSKFPIIDVKKYGGKQVAIVDGCVVAVGNTLEEVLMRAKKAVPRKPLNEIRIFFVPKTLSVIYYV
ncbi:MAG: DUF5678 domain-containing protein [bacterium]|nr:DUF5678 domain-containing protein [bacterium]